MKYCIVVVLLAFCLLSPRTAVADNRFIVRDSLGLVSLQNTCLLLGCNVVEGLDGALGQLFLVTAPSIIDPNLFILTLDEPVRRGGCRD